MGEWHPNAKRGLMLWHARRREKAPRKTGASLITPLPSSGEVELGTTGSLSVQLLAALESYGTWLTTADLLLRCPSWHTSRQTMLERHHKALRSLVAAGLARQWTWKPAGSRPVSFWAPGKSRPMNLEDAQELILRGVLFGDVFPQVQEEDRIALREWFVREPRLDALFPRNAPKVPVLPGSGNGCPKCGSPLVRDGKCELCPFCGESVGNCS